MKSYNNLYSNFQKRVGNNSADVLTVFKEDLNGTNQLVLTSAPWKFLEKTDTISTEASTARYTLFNDLGIIMEISVENAAGTITYRPRPVEDPAFWEYLQHLNTAASDVTEYYYQEGNDLLLYPTYLTASDTISVRYRRRQKELSRDDYTTGTIATATNGDETITGTSTAMTGRKPVGEQWMRFSTTSGEGDYVWYRIDSITSDTAWEFEKEYQGATFTGATLSYTLGEFSIMPGDYHDLLYYRPMALYYESQEEMTIANSYWRKYDGGHEAGLSPDIGGLLGQMMENEGGMRDAGYMSPHKNQLVFDPNFPPRSSGVTLN